MAQEEKFVHKASSGSLFKNKYKEKDTHPDYTGSCTDPNGNVYDLAGWVSKTKDGEAYFSLKVELPYVKEDFILLFSAFFCVEMLILSFYIELYRFYYFIFIFFCS